MHPDDLINKKLRYISEFVRIELNRTSIRANSAGFESNRRLAIRPESNIESNYGSHIEHRIELEFANSIFGRIELGEGPIRFETTSVYVFTM